MVIDEFTCTNCGATEGLRGTKTDGEIIELTCDECGHSWTRVPRQPCPRCASDDVETGGSESWSFDDTEEARDNTTTTWHYVDQRTFKCRKCSHEWKTRQRA